MVFNGANIVKLMEISIYNHAYLFRYHENKPYFNEKTCLSCNTQYPLPGCVYTSRFPYSGSFPVLFQASVQVACQFLFVEVLADEDDLLHAVAVFVVPILHEAGFLQHELDEVLFGSGGIP